MSLIELNMADGLLWHFAKFENVVAVLIDESVDVLLSR